MKKRIIPMIAIILLLCLTLTGCFSIVGGILDGLDAVFRFVQGFGEDNLPENAVFGSANNLAVGFRSGELVAFWDVTDNYKYVLSVTDDNGTTTVYQPDEDNDYADYYGNDCFYLKNIGLTYSDNFDISLKAINTSNIYNIYTASYNGLSTADYNTYTKNVAGGFTTIDSYIATRYEMFEYFAYLLIFRPDAKDVYKNKTSYSEIKANFYIAYDYNAIYDNTLSDYDAFEMEVLSAVNSFEDSAAYSYNYEKTGNIGTYTLDFYYPSDPYLISNSKNMYSNALKTENIHYTTAIKHDRTFPIDSRKQTVTVSSSDQLYFAIKKGYKPNPVPCSNADYIYTELKRILSVLNADTTDVPKKIHNIYDYIVNTVIYDYDFVDNIVDKKTGDESALFSYNCLYLEGVLGFQNGTFSAKDRVAICDGLSKAFLCMTQIEGIDSLKISGTANGGAHAWNKVKVGNRWYMVDTTWGNVLDSYNSGREYLSHDYLMVRDDANHKEDKWFSYPAATGKYNFLFS